MKNTKEFEGNDIDNAIENACASLKLPKKDLVYDIISSGSTGIFGIVGVKKARIRVTLPKRAPSSFICAWRTTALNRPSPIATLPRCG